MILIICQNHSHHSPRSFRLSQSGRPPCHRLFRLSTPVQFRALSHRANRAELLAVCPALCRRLYRRVNQAPHQALCPRSSRVVLHPPFLALCPPGLQAACHRRYRVLSQVRNLLGCRLPSPRRSLALDRVSSRRLFLVSTQVHSRVLCLVSILHLTRAPRHQSTRGKPLVISFEPISGVISFTTLFVSISIWPTSAPSESPSISSQPSISSMPSSQVIFDRHHFTHIFCRTLNFCSPLNSRV